MDTEQQDEKPAPWAAKGRKFLEEGNWLFIISDGTRMYAKMTPTEAAKALAGELFEAYHVLSVGGPQPLYLSSICKTEEPWTFSGARCSVLVPVHPAYAEHLDEKIKKLVDPPTITAVTEGKAKALGLHLD